MVSSEQFCSIDQVDEEIPSCLEGTQKWRLVWRYRPTWPSYCGPHYGQCVEDPFREAFLAGHYVWHCRWSLDECISSRYKRQLIQTFRNERQYLYSSYRQGA